MNNYLIGTETRMYNGKFSRQHVAYNFFIDDANKIWLVGNIDNKADYIYVSIPTIIDEKGMQATFDIVGHAGYLILENVFKSNAQSLYKATGMDLRKTYINYVVISRRRKDPVLFDVVYMDRKPILSTLNRGVKKTRRIVKERNESLYCYTRGLGGFNIEKINL